MIKKELLIGFSRKYFQETFPDTISRISLEWERNKEQIQKEYRSIFDQLFRQCLNMQKEGKKGKIKYLNIFYLHSSLITETYELQIELFDHNFYKDRQSCYRNWTPEFLIKYLKEDLLRFQKKAENEIIQFDYSDFYKVRKRYYAMFLVVIGEFFRKEIESVTLLASYQNMEKDTDIQIIYGGYLDEGILIWPKGEDV